MLWTSHSLNNPNLTHLFIIYLHFYWVAPLYLLWHKLLEILRWKTVSLHPEIHLPVGHVAKKGQDKTAGASPEVWREVAPELKGGAKGRLCLSGGVNYAEWWPRRRGHSTGGILCKGTAWSGAAGRVRAPATSNGSRPRLSLLPSSCQPRWSPLKFQLKVK